MSKNAKDTRSPDLPKRRENYEQIKGFDRLPWYMRPGRKEKERAPVDWGDGVQTESIER